MKNIWLIGAGPMAQEYFKVLNSLNVNVSVIGRGSNSAEKFKNETNFDLFQGGVKNFLSKPFSSLRISSFLLVGSPSYFSRCSS